jgi:hypothetical protein
VRRRRVGAAVRGHYFPVERNGQQQSHHDAYQVSGLCSSGVFFLYTKCWLFFCRDALKKALGLSANAYMEYKEHDAGFREKNGARSAEISH